MSFVGNVSTPTCPDACARMRCVFLITSTACYSNPEILVNAAHIVCASRGEDGPEPNGPSPAEWDDEQGSPALCVAFWPGYGLFDAPCSFNLGEWSPEKIFCDDGQRLASCVGFVSAVSPPFSHLIDTLNECSYIIQTPGEGWLQMNFSSLPAEHYIEAAGCGDDALCCKPQVLVSIDSKTQISALSFQNPPQYMQLAVKSYYGRVEAQNFKLQINTYLSDPSMCGDGILAPDEQCDDGNVVNDDGCTSSCNLEQRWMCKGHIREQADEVVVLGGPQRCKEKCNTDDPCKDCTTFWSGFGNCAAYGKTSADACRGISEQNCGCNTQSAQSQQCLNACEAIREYGASPTSEHLSSGLCLSAFYNDEVHMFVGLQSFCNSDADEFGIFAYQACPVACSTIKTLECNANADTVEYQVLRYRCAVFVLFVCFACYPHYRCHDYM